jgi:hypothetical protein
MSYRQASRLPTKIQENENMKAAYSFALFLLLGCLQIVGPQDMRPSSQDQGGNNEWEISAQYYPQDDRTVVMLKPMLVYEGEGICRGGLRFLAEFSYAGRKRQLPEAIALGFFTDPLSGIAGNELTVIADDERLPLGKMTLKHDAFHQWPGCRNAYDTTGLLVPRETFLKIVQARKVEVRANDKALPFAEKHFAALRELASRMMQK